MELIKITMGGYRYCLRVPTDLLMSPSAWTADRHCHADYEAHIILSGACTINVADVSRRLTALDAIIIAPGQYHCTTAASDDFAQFILTFTVRELTRDVRVYTLPSACVHLSENARTACLAIQTEIADTELFRNEALRAQYTLLLVELLRTRLFAASHEQNRNDSVSDQRFVLIDDFFERHLTEGGTAVAMAQELNLSHRQLSRVLMTHYGMNFREKLRCARMDRAGWLLRTTDLSVSDISKRVGYDSETSFFKAFKAHYGTTPLAYRKNKKKNEEPRT